MKLGSVDLGFHNVKRVTIKRKRVPCGHGDFDTLDVEVKDTMGNRAVLVFYLERSGSVVDLRPVRPFEKIIVENEGTSNAD